jgi:hypothetical protein
MNVTVETWVQERTGAGGVGGLGGRCGCEVIGCGGGHARPALVQTERRVGVGHQGGVRDDPHHPAVHADDEVVQPSRVTAREQQRDRREAHEQPDQAAGEGAAYASSYRQAPLWLSPGELAELARKGSGPAGPRRQQARTWPSVLPAQSDSLPYRAATPA